jgi:Domain of unknown function (DUF4148)
VSQTFVATRNLQFFIQEIIMKTKQLFALTALTLAASAVLADEAPGTPLTRAEVVQSVLAARANGTLRHTGEIAPEEMTADKAQIEAPSNLTAAQESAIVLQARAAHALAHTGPVAPEEDMEYAQAHPSTSTLARAEVKAEVLEARADGTLIPAGQAEDPELPSTSAPRVYAKAGRMASQMVASSSVK